MASQQRLTRQRLTSRAGRPNSSELLAPAWEPWRSTCGLEPQLPSNRTHESEGPVPLGSRSCSLSPRRRRYKRLSHERLWLGRSECPVPSLFSDGSRAMTVLTTSCFVTGRSLPPDYRLRAQRVALRARGTAWRSSQPTGWRLPRAGLKPPCPLVEEFPNVSGAGRAHILGRGRLPPSCRQLAYGILKRRQLSGHQCAQDNE